MTGLKILLKLHHDPHPWDDLWRAIVVEHPLRDAWWDGRNLLPLLHKVDIPVYLGCDWQNVPLHLPSTFPAFHGLTNSPHVQVAMLGEHGLAWPWESLHVEALAWFDHWLKGRDTGILDGPSLTGRGSATFCRERKGGTRPSRGRSRASHKRRLPYAPMLRSRVTRARRDRAP
jgi:hypothetical protein